MMVDGDAGFLRVNNRLAPHQLRPGEVYSATNRRFDEGKPRPRFGVSIEGWGMPGVNMIPDGTLWGGAGVFGSFVIVTGLTTGQTYAFAVGNGYSLMAIVSGSPISPVGGITTNGLFTAVSTQYKLWARTNVNGQVCTARIVRLGTPCAYARFNDPNGFDNGVLVTNDWRDQSGEDGGRGRAWRICPGNDPQEIDLNGHDVWSTARLIPNFNGMVLLRHGGERHYFNADAVDSGADTIALNCLPTWSDGDLVLYVPEDNSEIVPGPNPNARYYARTNASTFVTTLHGTKADAQAGTNAIDLGAAVGRFYLEKTSETPGFFGNGAQLLVLQPTDTLTAFENGFRALATRVVVTDTNATTDIITAPNHRLQPGDRISGALSTDTITAQYVYPLNDHQFLAYNTQDEALAGSGTEFNVTVDGQTGSIAKTTASAMATPPCREGGYYKGRFIGLNSKDNLIIGDPFDPLHSKLFGGTIPANLGESGNALWVAPLGLDTLLIGKEGVVLALTNLTQTATEWRLDDVTREYGAIAPRAVCNIGTDVWFLSRKGVASVVRTVAGEALGVARTVSEDIPAEINRIDWIHASIACMEVWNNRLFLAVPFKGQTGTVKNNAVLVYNFLNQPLQINQGAAGDQIIGSVETVGATDSWEGKWEGDMLTPYDFARLKINGDERLTFATSHGVVCWFADGFTDGSDTINEEIVTHGYIGGPIETELVTRGYFGGAKVVTLKGEIDWDTFNPSLTVAAKTAGWNEQTTILSALTKDNTKYLVDGRDDYNPESDDFDVPHRQDYSPSIGELFVASLDVHQNSAQPLRMRLRDRNPQLVITNTQGSDRINSVTLAAIPIGMAKSAKT